MARPVPMSSFLQGLRRYLSPAFWIFVGFSFITAGMYGIGTLSPAFADGVNRFVGTPLRFLLAHLTSWIPFSLAEWTILTLPVTLTLLCVWIVRTFRKNETKGIRLCCLLLAIAIAFYSLFLWMFGICYRGTSLDRRLGLDRTEVTAEELSQTAAWLAEEICNAAESVSFAEQSFSVMPYDYREMSDRLNDAYAAVSREHNFLPRLRANVKPVTFSKAMSYTHFTGVYIYYTGEANINVDFPTFTTVYTAAHEMSHQRGVAPEDEANFMAFLVCMASEDAYIRYCGYLNLFQYVATQLYNVDPDGYVQIYRTLPLAVRYELYAYSRFFEQYRDSATAKISDAVNDSYLKSHGQRAGSQSYGLVVDLAVAYYRTLQTPPAS